MNFNIKQTGRKINRNKSLAKLLKSPAIAAGSLKSANTRWLSCRNELCDRIKLLLPEKQAGSNSNLTDEKIAAIAYKLLEYNCIST